MDSSVDCYAGGFQATGRKEGINKSGESVISTFHLNRILFYIIFLFEGGGGGGGGGRERGSCLFHSSLEAIGII